MYFRNLGWLSLCFVTFGCSAEEMGEDVDTRNSELVVSIVEVSPDREGRIKLNANYENSSRESICIFPRLGHSVVIEPALSPGAFLIGEAVEGQKRPRGPLEAASESEKVELPPGGNEIITFSVSVLWFNTVIGRRPDGQAYSDVAKTGRYRIGLNGYAISCSDGSATPKGFRRIMKLSSSGSAGNIYQFKTEKSKPIALIFPPVQGRVIVE